MHLIENKYQRMATTFKNNFWKGKIQNRLSLVKWGGGDFGSEILSSRETETHATYEAEVEW